VAVDFSAIVAILFGVGCRSVERATYVQVSGRQIFFVKKHEGFILVPTLDY